MRLDWTKKRKGGICITTKDKVEQLLEGVGMKESIVDLFDQLRELDEIIGGKDSSKKLDDLDSEIVSNLSTICDKNLSEKELGAAIAFLQSPAGPKLIKTLSEFQRSIERSAKDFLERGIEEEMEEMVSKARDDEAMSPRLVGVVVITEEHPEEEVELKTGKTIPRNRG